MKNVIIPEQIDKILNILESNGYEGYIVGGAIRDYFLGIKPFDFDITTNASVDVMYDLFNNYKIIKTGIKHGTISIICDGINVEITTYRDNNKTLKGDLLLRDFTINAIAYSSKSGIIDYYDGINDIKNKIIKVNGNDDSRFKEDPLRIMRAVRLSATLNFEIDYSTKKFMLDNVELLNDVSVERIREEFNKILLSDHPSTYIREYLDIFTTFIPELIPLKGFNQNNPHHIHDCLEHTLIVLDNVNNDIVMRLTALFHDSGKPATYTEDINHIGHFYNHYKVSIDIAKSVLRRLKYSNDITSRVIHLIKYHDYPLTLTNKSIKKLLRHFGSSDIYNLLNLKRADVLGQNPAYINNLKNIDKGEAIITDLISTSCFSLDKLKITGKDLITLGITDGKEIGYILGQLLDLVIDDNIKNDKTILIKKAIEISKIKR